MQKDNYKKNTNGPDPGIDAPSPILFRQPAGLKKQRTERAKDPAIDVSDFMEQVVKEMPDGRRMAFALRLPTGSAILAMKYLPAIAAPFSRGLPFGRVPLVRVPFSRPPLLLFSHAPPIISSANSPRFTSSLRSAIILDMAQMVHGVDPANNAPLAELESKTGPNNFFRAMAHKPDVLAAFPKLYGAVMGRGSLDRRLKEMVYLAVSMVNECSYCTAAHLKGAPKAGLSERDLEDLRSETNQNFSVTEQTALHYAREMTRSCADEFGTRAHLREHFTEEQLVELTLVIAMANFTNRFNNGLNVQVEKPVETAAVA